MAAAVSPARVMSELVFSADVKTDLMTYDQNKQQRDEPFQSVKKKKR